MNIKKNLKKIIPYLEENKVKLVAVTKNHSVQEVQTLIENGVFVIGENRVREAKEKFQFLPEKIEKHFIGRIQTNKIKEIVKLFDFIQSVDKGKYLLEINKQAEKLEKIMPLLVQVNISHEQQKGGCTPDELPQVLAVAQHLKNIRICGLMGMAEFSEDLEVIRSQFAFLKNIFEKVKKWDLSQIEMQFLSMGMSHDYRIAVAEGANMVRIGGGIFG